MTLAGSECMGRISQTGRSGPARPKDRLRAYLERDYRGRPTALARELEVGVKAAENLLNGNWPSDLTFGAIVRRFGQDVLAAVCAPEIDPVLARLTQETRELEEALERKRAEQRQVAGGESGLPEPVAANEGQARRS